MIKRNVFFSFTIIFAITIFLNSTNIYAQPDLDIKGQSVILIEENSGKILYKKEENKRMFPASTTKILTALVAMEYLKLDSLYVVGTEINNIPSDSSIAGNKVGESITGENLIRGLIIPSGNETACVVAMQVAKISTGNEKLTYPEAEKIFSNMMNEKAKKLGANNSNFMNPHGYHNENHYTTAYDMALISREVMKNETIRKLVKEETFEGNGAGENHDTTLKTQVYNWYTHNLLLNSKLYAYEYATGIKTGFTKEAGDSVTASAEKDDKKLIAVVYFSEDPNRWLDAKILFDYGFDNFNYEHVQEKGKILSKAVIENAKLGESNEIEILAETEFVDFLSTEELASITNKIEYTNENIIKSNDNTLDLIKVPVAENEVLGKVTYYLDGKDIFTGNIVASKTVEQRTLKTDIKYYLNVVKDNAFTINAIPYWAVIIASIVVIVFIVTFIKKIKSKKGFNLRK